VALGSRRIVHNTPDTRSIRRRLLMSRRLVSLTLDTLEDLPRRCRQCVFWELDPVSAETGLVGNAMDLGAYDGGEYMAKPAGIPST